uniref:Non-specific protein-tyrosine kinase n=1 Tax=Sexangularia sp. CB-2014 TaxID=1486929 RepID=A0A7S1YGR3_9EUKA|mmetsp:Transcript_3020/g.9881  ORF Transcript_3020/g.9881 Transcript_3020/m.9881 type:complete len:1354 (+) Transcript_3020:94-4155(+)
MFLALFSFLYTLTACTSLFTPSFTLEHFSTNVLGAHVGLWSTNDSDSNTPRNTSHLDIVSERRRERQTEHAHGGGSTVWGKAWRPSDGAGSGVIRVEDADATLTRRYAPSLVAIASQLHQDFGVQVSAHVYRSAPRSRPILGFHTDPYDTLIVGLAGTKRWTLCTPRSTPHTVARAAQEMEIRTGRLAGCTPFGAAEVLHDASLSCRDTLLEPGHVLYLPKGVIHRARAESPAGTEHATFSLARTGTMYANLLRNPARLSDPSLPVEAALALSQPLPLRSLTVCGIVCLDRLQGLLRNASGDTALTRADVRRRLTSILRRDRSPEATWPGLRRAEAVPDVCDLPSSSSSSFDEIDDDIRGVKRQVNTCTCECDEACDGGCVDGCDDAPCLSSCDADCDGSCIDCCTQDCDEGCLCTSAQGGADCDEDCLCTALEGGTWCDSLLGIGSCDVCPPAYCDTSCDECPSQFCTAACDTCTCGCTTDCDADCDEGCANGCDEGCTTACDDECDGCCPTPAPTGPPTAMPSPLPTTSPTPFPTATPTASPTPAPPTPQPTGPPTPEPTSSPTPRPTTTPTVAPTRAPTRTPTLSPSAAPTNVPTPHPTAAPTRTPTPSPTASPTVAPFIACGLSSAPCADDGSVTCIDASQNGHFVCSCLDGFVISESVPAMAIRGRVDGGQTGWVVGDVTGTGDLVLDDAAPADSWGAVSFDPLPDLQPGDALGCRDVDECQVAADLCRSDATCDNTRGSFRCACIDEALGTGFSSCFPRNVSRVVSADQVVFIWNHTCGSATQDLLEALRLTVATELEVDEARVHVAQVQCESVRSPMLLLFAFSVPAAEGDPARIDVLNRLVREGEVVASALGVLATIPVGVTTDVTVDGAADAYYGDLPYEDDGDGGEGGLDGQPVGDAGASDAPLITASTAVMLGLALFIVCFLIFLIAARIRRMHGERSEEGPSSHLYGVAMHPTVESLVPASRGVTGSGGYHLPPARDLEDDGIDTFSSLGVQVEFLIHGRELVRLNKIGEGAFGLVLRGSWGDKEVAIKEVKGTSVEARKQLLDEGTKLTKLPPHENVVTFYGVCDSPPAIVLQFCDGGSLLSRLYGKQDGVKSLAELERQSIALDIARGLEHLHRARVVHRDVAARNVLLHEGVAKLTDMGMSRDSIEPGDGDDYLNAAYEPVDNYYQQTKSAVGPLKWMAPEQLTKRIISFKADVYSFGIVMYELSMGRPPFLGSYESIVQQMEELRADGHTVVPYQPLRQDRRYHNDLAALIESCLTFDEAARATPRTAQASPFFRRFADDEPHRLEPSHPMRRAPHPPAAPHGPARDWDSAKYAPFVADPLRAQGAMPEFRCDFAEL